MQLQNQYRDMSALEKTPQEAELSSLSSRSTQVPITAPASTKRRAPAPAEPTSSVKKTKTVGKYDEVANLLQQHRPPPVVVVQQERDTLKEELQKTREEAAKQKAEVLQELHKTKVKTAAQQTRILQQLQGTVHLTNEVRSQLDTTMAERDRELRKNLALRDQLGKSIEETRSAKSQAESVTSALSQSRVHGSRLQQDLTQANTALKDAKKELTSTKKEAALTKQVLLKQKDEVKKELDKVKTNASATEKILKSKNEEVTNELVLTKTDAAVTEKLLENKVEQLERAEEREKALYAILMQQVEHEHQGNEQALSAIKKSLYNSFGVHMKED